MRVLLRELGFLKRHWRRVALAYLSVFGSAGFAVAAPWIIKEAIDVGLRRQDTQFLIYSGLLIIAAAVLRGICQYGQTYLGEYISQAVAYDIRNAIYDRLQRLSYAYHDKQQTGQLMSRATADVEGVRMFVFMGSVRLVFVVLLTLAACYLLFSLNWGLTLVVLALLPLLAYRAIATSLKLRPNWLAVQEAIAQLGIVLQENLSGVRVVKAFVREEFESRKFGSIAGRVRDLNYRTNRIQSFNSSLMSFIQVLIVAVILWYGGREVMEGRLTEGGLAAFIGYMAMLTQPVRALGWMANVFARAISAGERIFEILDAESEVKEQPGAMNLPAVQGHVAFEHVSFHYAPSHASPPLRGSSPQSSPPLRGSSPQSSPPLRGRVREGGESSVLRGMAPVLTDVSFEVKPGKMVALLGATGSGKSTVVNLLPRFYDVTEGRITIDGHDIRDVTLASLRRNVGIVHQDVFLFADTMRNNLAYGAKDASDGAVEAAARTARLHDFIMSLPAGYGTWVGERGITLSGGQKQRVAIARTLLTDPRVLILDDSTSSVDMETEYLIQQALAELMAGRTTFVIAQRLRTVVHADLILVLERGEIVEAGTHRELLRMDGPYREIYDLQLRDQEEAGQSLAHEPVVR